MSPLAEAIYDVLRRRRSLADPHITYAELARQMRDASDQFELIHHRSRELYAALNEVGRECRRIQLPPLPALVVRSDTGRPGAAYNTARRSGPVFEGERIAAWRRDLEAVKRTVYPRRRGKGAIRPK